MVESPDFIDPVHEIPVFSLYGEVRRPTGQSMSTFDVVLIDLQDLGCRIYTFITTLLYMLEAAAEHGKECGRSTGQSRRPPDRRADPAPGWESFVGAGPIPMRHGLTLGELGRWFVDHFKLDVDYRVIEMEGYRPDEGPGFGWPTDRIWVNPSPNAPNLNMARCYAGTVMLEGTTLSEGRGTTRPLDCSARRHRGAGGDQGHARTWRRNGSTAASCATFGSSRPSTSTSTSYATASISMPKATPTTTPHSSRGGSSRATVRSRGNSVRMALKASA